MNQENIFLSTKHLKPLNVWIHDVCSLYVPFQTGKALTHFSALIYTLDFSVLPQHKKGEQTNNTGISVNVVKMFPPTPAAIAITGGGICSTPYIELLIWTLTSQYIIFRLYRLHQFQDFRYNICVRKEWRLVGITRMWVLGKRVKEKNFIWFAILINMFINKSRIINSFPDYIFSLRNTWYTTAWSGGMLCCLAVCSIYFVCVIVQGLQESRLFSWMEMKGFTLNYKCLCWYCG